MTGTSTDLITDTESRIAERTAQRSIWNSSLNCRLKTVNLLIGWAGAKWLPLSGPGIVHYEPYCWGCLWQRIRVVPRDKLPSLKQFMDGSFVYPNI